MTVIYFGIITAALVFALGCGGFSMDTYWRSGDYILVAVDTRGQMSLVVDDRGGASSPIIGPTIFSIGSDDHYIVVKQHPSRDEYGSFDRSVTNYFIVDRNGEGKAVRGPLSAGEFSKIETSQSLPSFTKTFSDLE